jgi:purine-binding chemotaxis protein CheW
MTQSATPGAAASMSAGSLAGKYMTFRLDSEDYGLAILKVRELIGLMDITRVPGTRNYIRGVINLRGKVIPIVDLRLKFGMGQIEPTNQTVIIVVQITSPTGPLTMGVVVDEVLEVRNIEAGQIEPAPELNAGEMAEYVLGVGKIDKRVLFLLDIDRVLSPQEQLAVANTLDVA